MTRALRQRHRRIIAVLVIVVPAAFAAGLVMRQPVPVESALPAGLSPEGRFQRQEWERGDMFSKARLQVRLLRERSGGGSFALQFSPPQNFVKPDLIVYWSAGEKSVSGELPNDALLLGAVGAELELPAEIIGTKGRLLLYSLADGELVDVSGTVRFDASIN
jgi:hypothetical protein